MKRFAFILFITITAVGTLLAANQSDATRVLDKATQKVSIGRGVQMNFSISSTKIKQSGTITIKGKKFRATTPIATIWYDGKTQWTYNKKSDEVNIASPSASTQQSMNPYYFLNLYKQGYTKSMTKTGKVYDIHLVGKGRKISEMYVTIDKNYNLKQIKIKQGNEWMTISVSGVRNVTPSDSFFRFNSKDYPKAEVIDLR